MNPLETLLTHAATIEAKLGYQFKNRSFLLLAFIHRSFVNEHKAITDHNERLEFLGDAVLGMLVSDFLYQRMPNTAEGDLSFLRSRLVEASSCVGYVQSLDIYRYMLLGKGERYNEGRGKETILSDLFEAIIGAIFLDGGLEAARNFLFNNFESQIQATLETPLRNWKAALQDLCQKRFQQAPVYSVLDESGPDHVKQFSIAVMIGTHELGRGTGASKKEAQQAAAANALSKELGMKANG